MSRAITGLILLLLYYSFLLSSCNHKPQSENICSSSEITSIRKMMKVNAKDLAIYFDTSIDKNIEITKKDFVNYIERLWNNNVPEISDGKPDFSKPVIIWFSTTDEGEKFLGEAIDNGFIMKKINSGSSTIFLVFASDNINLSFAIYNFLEELGIRFFHPTDEFVPKFSGIFLPQELNSKNFSPFKTRGIHLHLLHPIEYFRSFNEVGEENLKEARKFIDWLVKTGQNYIQWSILKTLDFPRWIEHAKNIVDYAHMRGLKVGAEIQLLSSASLQNSFVLVSSEKNWKEQIRNQIDFLMNIPWDNIEIGFGEFFSSNPEELIDMLNYIIKYTEERYPHVTISVVNHVGNYPNLWINYKGESIFYYHLPKFADPRIVNNVHTVFFFDLFRDWGGYGHPNFHLHRDYLIELLPSRIVRYKPESAYWCSADIDVPAFLPEYIHSRWIDINGLVNEIEKRKLPMIEGHIMFSSGHEWGYWMTDYLTAKMLWNPKAEFKKFIEHYSIAYGNCSDTIERLLLEFINLQTIYLFDNRLVPFISGEDIYDDIGYMAGIETHPKRVQFEELLKMTQEELRKFETDKIDKLKEMADKIIPLESELEIKCNASDSFIRTWCSELYDGFKIIRLRLMHSYNLYKAVIGKIKGEDFQKYIDEAEKIRGEAEKTIKNREQFLRFDLERLTGSYTNPTIYPFGYLRQAHTLCFWNRQEEQAKYVIEKGEKPPISDIRTCID